MIIVGLIQFDLAKLSIDIIMNRMYSGIHRSAEILKGQTSNHV